MRRRSARSTASRRPNRGVRGRAALWLHRNTAPSDEVAYVEIGVLARHAPLVATLKAGSTRIHLGGNEIIELATGPGFFKVETDRALALVDDAVNVREIDDARAQGQLEAARAELEKLDAGEGTGDRWQLEQRVAHAENQLRVSGRTTG